MNSFIKVLIPTLLISTFFYSISIFLASSGFNVSFIGDIFSFIQKGMYSMDWLIPYSTQFILFSSFLIVEGAIIVFRVSKWLIHIYS
ncbi:hypothetical protein EOL94_04525 [bacterium]|nr:hypothetical protein [bacterium]